jgi:hypothetical protein
VQPRKPEKTEADPPNGKQGETGSPEQGNPRPEITVYKGDSKWPNPTEWILIGISILVLSTNVFVCSQVTTQTSAMKDQATASIEQTKLATDALNSAKESSVASERVSTRSLAVAEKSLDNARMGNANYERIAKTATRSYIGVEGPVLDTAKTGEQRVNVWIRNTGPSIAHNVYVVGMLTGGDSLDMDAIKLRSIADRHRNQRSSLAPGLATKRPFRFFKGMSPNDIAHISNNGNFFVIGIVFYRDVYQVSHHLMFCFFYISSNREFVLHDNYNEAD